MKVKNDVWERLRDKIHYHQSEFRDFDGYMRLDRFIEKISIYHIQFSIALCCP